MYYSKSITRTLENHATALIRTAEASEKYAKSLKNATWVLAVATIVLAITAGLLAIAPFRMIEYRNLFIKDLIYGHYNRKSLSRHQSEVVIAPIKLQLEALEFGDKQSTTGSADLSPSIVRRLHPPPSLNNPALIPPERGFSFLKMNRYL